MPKLVRTIDYYTCEYKCGHKAEPLYKMVRHEEMCFCNPNNKACRICANCESQTEYTICNKLELQIKNSNPNLVLDFNNLVVWEVLEYDVNDYDEVEKIYVNNSNRPFPKTNCEHFKLGKKIY